MRKVIVLEFISLDGVIQAPGGRDEDTDGDFKFGGWTAPFFDDEAGKIMEEQMKGEYDLLLGRKTYDIFSNYWPQNEDKWPGVNDKTKYVASNTKTSGDWKNTIFLKDVVEELKKIKAQDGTPLQVYGSSSLAQTLLKNDLVDELWLKFFPVTLGHGKKLFGEGTIPAGFKLTSSKVTPSGVIFASYKRDGDVKTGSMV